MRDGLGIEAGCELGRNQQTLTAHLGHAVDLLQALGEVDAGARRALGDLLSLHHSERGQRRAGGQRLPAERGRVIAGRERLRHLGARPARTDRHAVAERLGHRDDVG